MKRTRSLVSVCLIVALLVLITACAQPQAPAPASAAPAEQPAEATAEQSAQPQEPAKTGGHILFAPIYTGSPYMLRGYEFAKKYAESMGYTIELQGPTNIDPVALVNTLTDCLAKDVDILITTSSDPHTLAPILKQYQEKGTLVVTWDLDVLDTSARDAYAGLCDIPIMGDAIIHDMVKIIGEDDFEYAILNGMLTSVFLQQRVDRMIEVQKEYYPNLKLVTVESGDGDVAKSLVAAQNILTAYPNVKAIIANSSEISIPICQAIEQAGKVGQTKAFGHGTPDSLKPYFEKGIMGAISMWDPGEWGEWTAVIGIALHQGKTFEKGKISDFPAFPDAELLDDNVYYFNKMFTYTKENVNDFDW